jgi:hypothetical protein
MLRSDYEVFLVAMSNVPNIQFLLGGAVTHYELHLNHPDDRVGLRYIPVAPYRLSRSFDIGRQGQFSDGRFHIFSARVEKAPGFRGASSVDSRGAGDETIADARSDSDAPLLIGRRADMSFPLKGQVAEVLIYRSALSPPMRSQVLTYLIRKYRLTVR